MGDGAGEVHTTETDGAGVIGGTQPAGAGVAIFIKSEVRHILQAVIFVPATLARNRVGYTTVNLFLAENEDTINAFDNLLATPTSRGKFDHGANNSL